MPLYAAVFWVASFSATESARAEFATNQSVAATEILDIDGNGSVEALTDGLLVMRYTFGLRGQALIQGVIGQGATRTTAAQIESYLASLTSTIPGNCKLTASPGSSAATPLAAGTQVQLTASCSSDVTPIIYGWNNGFIGTVQTVAPQTTTTYTVTPSNSNGAGIAFSTTVYIGTIIAPSNCSVSQSPNTSTSPAVAGTNVNLSVRCGGGTAPTSCSWSNGIASTTCTIDIAAPSTTTGYSVTASNAAGSAAPVSTTINVTQGEVAQNFCTPGVDDFYPVTYPPGGQFKYTTNGFKDQRIAFRIDIPSTFNPPLNINHIGFLRLAEVPGQAVVVRGFTISKNACDFQTGNYLFNGLESSDTAPYVSFAIDNPEGYKAAGATINIKSGETIYLNVRNRFHTSNTCPYASCDVSLDFATPNRY